MSAEQTRIEESGRQEAVAQLEKAAAAKKCLSCGCLHNSLASIESAFPKGQIAPDLEAAVHAARGRLVEVQYECLGCEVCYPALATNALNQATADHGVELDACPTNEVEARQGWPPLPGSYAVLRYQAPVAVCTLADDQLAATAVRQAGPETSIVGTLQTENLGIERLVLNIVANPNIRFLVVCGLDSRQAIGHLPGQSLVALARSGLDDRSRIAGANGRRPIIKNVSLEAVDHFRSTVEVVDLVGNSNPAAVLDAARTCAARSPGPADPFAKELALNPVQGYLLDRMMPDPAGYFVVYVDRHRHVLSLEHYGNEGVLDLIIAGRTAAELYAPAIDKGLISRLDHAAYLGRELARAERALSSGESYVQDGAPEHRTIVEAGPGCGCSSPCEEKSS
ncbi:MAG: DUF4346 domain-containing protein [Acidobacteria bacterium]|nr:DUF4346 domain-containing protein [Acidobacteriota bacterium]